MERLKVEAVMFGAACGIVVGAAVLLVVNKLYRMLDNALWEGE